MEEWEQKAASSESRANKLEAKMSMLSMELERLREEDKKQGTGTAAQTPCWDAQKEMEKRVLVCRLKENHQHHKSNENNSKQKVTSSDGNRKAANTVIMTKNGTSGTSIAQKRSPLQDVGNSSELIGRQQHSKAIFPLLHCPRPPKTSQNF